jgi:hypothetical protein
MLYEGSQLKMFIHQYNTYKISTTLWSVDRKGIEVIVLSYIILKVVKLLQHEIRKSR